MNGNLLEDLLLGIVVICGSIVIAAFVSWLMQPGEPRASDRPWVDQWAPRKPAPRNVSGVEKPWSSKKPVPVTTEELRLLCRGVEPEIFDITCEGGIRPCDR